MFPSKLVNKSNYLMNRKYYSKMINANKKYLLNIIPLINVNEKKVTIAKIHVNTNKKVYKNDF